MIFDIITLFPEMFAALNCGITGRAQENGLIIINYWNPRDYAKGNYRKVDDSPYGGGPGMVMMVEPLQAAIKAAKLSSDIKPFAINLTPQGELLTQKNVTKLFENKRLVLISGRYEGIDERIIDLEVDAEISIGDYVLSGGEIPAMVVIDALTRLIPGALGDENSALEDSFVDGLLDYPHYTRPESISGKNVPAVLLSGDHKLIARWRRKQALGRTWLRRPELIAKLVLTAADTVLLNEFIKETDFFV